MCCTRLRHFVKLDLEAPVERYASPSFNPGRACCSSTACSALMVPTSMRVAPRAIPNVRTTRCTWIRSSVTACRRKYNVFNVTTERTTSCVCKHSDSGEKWETYIWGQASRGLVTISEMFLCGHVVRSLTAMVFLDLLLPSLPPPPAPPATVRCTAPPPRRWRSYPCSHTCLRATPAQDRV